MAKNKLHPICIFLIAAFLILSFFTSSAYAVTISKNSGQFLVDGQAKFLLLISYFDAMDASNLDSDLNYIKSKGFDGIRIFPNWWNADENDELAGASNATLMDGNGNLRPGRLDRLRSVIDKADSRGLAVDVTFARETVPGNCQTVLSGGTPAICEPEFKNGVAATVQGLRNFKNIFYDLQNEGNDPDTLLSNASVVDLKNRIKVIDPSTIVSVSVAGSQTGGYAVNYSNQNNLDLVNFHDPISTTPGQHATTISSALTSNKPTYIGEPYTSRTIRNNDAYTAEAIMSIAGDAKRIGIAAWTFHTRAGFDLSNNSFSSDLTSKEKAVMNGIKSYLDSINWGNGDNYPPQPPQPPGGNGEVTGSQGGCPDGYVELGEANATTSDPTATDGYFCDDDPPASGISGLTYPITGNLYCSNTKSGSAFVVSDQYGGCNTRVGIRPGWKFINGRPFTFDESPVTLIGENRCANNQSVSVTINSNKIAIGAWVNDPGGGKSGYFCVRAASQPQPQPQPQPPTTPTGPPTITGISPQIAVVGETVEISGTNLTETVRLENLSDGKFYTVTASLNTDLTTASLEVPDIPGGNYKVSVSGPKGSATSPQNLTVKTGGSPFSAATQPTIPVEGLYSFGQLIATIFTWSLNVLGIVVFVMIFYAGFMWFTAAGNTARVNEAKSKITNAVTGAIILLAAYIILYTINPDLVGGVLTLPGIGG